ncbi:MurR/RpiR family transcriptional regulator [Pararhodobacter oceanensis]|uniref:MurR/RpiR family transcriptional regulator n=1 Tax=Pararhodobacter oceanensis TaxID=2172121 RepID=UPI003A9361BA
MKPARAISKNIAKNIAKSPAVNPDKSPETMPETPPVPETLDDLLKALAELVHTAPPAIGKLAAWALENPQDMAFHSVRTLAAKAEVNANTVFRLSVALGFSGFEPCREAFQAAFRKDDATYGLRAQRLHAGDGAQLPEQIKDAAHRNLDALFSTQHLGQIAQAVDLMLSARTIYCVGVRSCFALAHYLAYSGHMALENFAPPLTQSGSIADAIIGCGAEDLVVVISFAHYSLEVVRAHEIATARGARLIAITDSYTAPIARGADVVFDVPMEGPQSLPSLGAAFALTEALVGEMIIRSDSAAARIADYERQLLDFGVYI